MILLNEKQKKQVLRDKTIDLLKDIPEGKRAHIDKEILESLLFEEIVYNKETNEKLKLPVWSGDFLKKIDLSEIDFEDVAWDLVVEDTFDFPEEPYEPFMDKETFKEMEKTLPKLAQNEKINYSGTNAKIDFKKSFSYKKLGLVNVMFCDFSSTDLSNNYLDKVDIFESDFSNTGLNIDLSKITMDDIYCVNLTNINLNGLTIDIFKYMDGREPINECILTNTGVKIVYNWESEYLKENPKYYTLDSRKWDMKKVLHELIPDIRGCYLNDRRIPTKEEMQALKDEKVAELMAYKKELTAPLEESFKKDNMNI